MLIMRTIYSTYIVCMYYIYVDYILKKKRKPIEFLLIKQAELPIMVSHLN